MDSAIEKTGDHEGRRILVVDDDLDFSAGLRELLESRGYRVATAADKETAHQAAKSFLPEIALIDICLGSGNGNNLISKLKNHQSAPVCVIMTAYAGTESSIEALESGAYDVLAKPVMPVDLFVTLGRCLDRIELERERQEARDKLELRNRELEHVNQRLGRVVECMGALSSSTTVADFYQQLLEKVAFNMGVEGGSVYIHEGDQLALKHSLDPGHAPSVIPMPLKANSVLGRVMEQAEVVLVSDVASSNGLMLSGWSGYRDASLLALPLTGQDDNIIGILSLHTKQQPPFTPQDRDVGRILLAASSETLRAVKALEELQESQSMLQLIMDSVPECVKVLDKDGNILQMNKAGLDMFGAETFDQIKGACLYPYIKSEYQEAVQKLNEQALEEGAIGKMEYVLRGLKGKDLWLDTHVAPLRNTDQEIIGVLGVTRDITADKRLLEKTRQQELQLMQASKMAALGTLVAGMAHEINNPNQSIQINSGLLRQVWEDTRKILDEHVSTHGPIKLGGLQYSGVSGAHTDLINDIITGAEQIKTIVGRLQTFARPYNGIHENISGAKIQLNDAVEPALALFRHAIRKGTDNFHTNLEDALPVIQADRQQLQQVVINLLLNALEALPDRSRGVWIDTRLNAEQSCVELRVRDEGIGIKPEELDQVMDPFYTTRREQGGTGLGLSITHSLLQGLGGTIHFESEPGKGTLVVVCLPVVEH